MVLKNYLDKYNGDGGATTAEGRQKKAYEFFIGKGYTPEQSAGIVGNLIQESTPNLKTQIEGFDGTGSLGLAQWLGDRKKRLKEVQKDNWNTFQGQLEFIDWELKNTETRAAQKLSESTSPQEAAEVFSKYYERPHKDYAHNNKRANYAKGLLDKYSKNSNINIPREEIIDTTQDTTDRNNFIVDIFDDELKNISPEEITPEKVQTKIQQKVKEYKQQEQTPIAVNSQVDIEPFISQLFNDPSYNNVKLND